MTDAEPVRRGDRGTTLVELTVAMVVFGVFSAFLATLVLQTTRLTRESSVREVSSLRASALAQQLTKDLRTAVRIGPTSATQTAFVEATPSQVVFYSSVASAIVKETLSVVTTGASPGVHRTIKKPDPTSVYPALTYDSTLATQTSTRRLADADVSPAGLFTYVLKNGTTESTVTTVAPADLPRIVAVKVRIELDGDGVGGQRPVVLRSTVRPYNP